MLDVGERLRRETGSVVIATLPATEWDLAAPALVSGRADVVVTL